MSGVRNAPRGTRLCHLSLAELRGDSVDDWLRLPETLAQHGLPLELQSRVAEALRSHGSPVFAPGEVLGLNDDDFTRAADAHLIATALRRTCFTQPSDLSSNPFTPMGLRDALGWCVVGAGKPANAMQKIILAYVPEAASAWRAYEAGLTPAEYAIAQPADAQALLSLAALRGSTRLAHLVDL